MSRWLRPKGSTRGGYKYQCSECKEICYCVTGNCGKKVKIDNPPCPYKYCPHCGAKVEDKPKVEMNIYDEEEIHENCTVQILKNSATGDISIGWWEN